MAFCNPCSISYSPLVSCACAIKAQAAAAHRALNSALAQERELNKPKIDCHRSFTQEPEPEPEPEPQREPPSRQGSLRQCSTMVEPEKSFPMVEQDVDMECDSDPGTDNDTLPDPPPVEKDKKKCRQPRYGSLFDCICDARKDYMVNSCNCNNLNINPYDMINTYQSSQACVNDMSYRNECSCDCTLVDLNDNTQCNDDNCPAFKRSACCCTDGPPSPIASEAYYNKKNMYNVLFACECSQDPCSESQNQRAPYERTQKSTAAAQHPKSSNKSHAQKSQMGSNLHERSTRRTSSGASPSGTAKSKKTTGPGHKSSSNSSGGSGASGASAAIAASGASGGSGASGSTSITVNGTAASVTPKKSTGKSKNASQRSGTPSETKFSGGESEPDLYGSRNRRDSMNADTSVDLCYLKRMECRIINCIREAICEGVRQPFQCLARDVQKTLCQTTRIEKMLTCLIGKLEDRFASEYNNSRYRDPPPPPPSERDYQYQYPEARPSECPDSPSEEGICTCPPRGRDRQSRQPDYRQSRQYSRKPQYDRQQPSRTSNSRSMNPRSMVEQRSTRPPPQAYESTYRKPYGPPAGHVSSGDSCCRCCPDEELLHGLNKQKMDDRESDPKVVEEAIDEDLEGDGEADQDDEDAEEEEEVPKSSRRSSKNKELQDSFKDKSKSKGRESTKDKAKDKDEKDKDKEADRKSEKSKIKKEESKVSYTNDSNSNASVKSKPAPASSAASTGKSKSATPKGKIEACTRENCDCANEPDERSIKAQVYPIPNVITNMNSCPEQYYSKYGNQRGNLLASLEYSDNPSFSKTINSNYPSCSKVTISKEEKQSSIPPVDLIEGPKGPDGRWQENPYSSSSRCFCQKPST